MFPDPRMPDKPIRRRLVAPAGMDSIAAEAWGMRHVSDVLREFGKSTNTGEKENAPHDTQRANKPASSSIPTLRQFWPRFIEEYAEPSLKQGSRDSYESVWRHHIGPALGDYPIDRIDLAEIAKLTRACRVKGLLASYRNLICGKLLVMIRKAAEVGLIPQDAVPKVPWEKVKNRPKVFTSEQVEFVIRVTRRHLGLRDDTREDDRLSRSPAVAYPGPRCG